MTRKITILFVLVASLILCAEMLLWHWQRCNLLQQSSLQPIIQEKKITPDNAVRIEYVHTDPVELTQRLAKIEKANQQTIREILFCLQGLTDVGIDSIPAIQDYLDTKHDLELIPLSSDDAYRKIGTEFLDVQIESGLSPSYSIFFPASIRAGIIDVLRAMNSPEANAVIAEFLTHYLQTYELIYAANALLEIDFNAYKETVLAVVRDKLAMASTISERVVFFRLLGKFKDDYMGEVMLSYLYMNGQIDDQAVRFVVETMGEKALFSISSLFNATEGLSEKCRLFQNVKSYVGRNADADAMFKELFGMQYPPVSPASPYTRDSVLKDFFGFKSEIVRVVNMNGSIVSQQITRDTSLSPELATARLQLIEELRQHYANDNNKLDQAFDLVEEQLDYVIHPDKFQTPPEMDWGKYLETINYDERN